MIQPAAPQKLIIAVLALIKFIVPFILIAPEFGLHRDEFLYYEQGQHLAIGYLENPPFIAYLASISSILGGNEWTVRLWPAAIGAITLIYTCLIAARLGGGGWAQLLAGIGILSGVYMRIHILFQPNILDILFWTTACYYFVRFIQTRHASDLAGIIFSLALGWWSKYSIVFIAIPILVSLNASVLRKNLYNARTYGVWLAAILIVIPNLIWQFTRNFPLVHHMRELRETQLVNISPVSFLVDQVMMLFPVAIIWIWGLVWLLRKPLYRLLTFIFLGVIILLLLTNGKNYYSVGAFPVLLAAGSVAIEKFSATRAWIKYLVLALAILLNFLFAPIVLPLINPGKMAGFYDRIGAKKMGILKWEDQQDHPLPQDFADMIGWKELASKTRSSFNKLPDSMQSETIIYCRNYGQAGAVKFYNDRRIDTITISDNGTFLIWIPDSIHFKHLLYVGRRIPTSDDEVFNHFESMQILDSVNNPLSRQMGDKIILYRNADSLAARLARIGLSEEKARFKR